MSQVNKVLIQKALLQINLRIHDHYRYDISKPTNCCIGMIPILYDNVEEPTSGIIQMLY